MIFGIDLGRRRYLLLWQLALLVLGTTWLWAPQLNHVLSYRTTLISQYETPSQPYSWLFRLCDFLSGLLVIFMANYIFRKGQSWRGWLLTVVGLGMMLDPLLSTTCREVGNTCREYFSAGFVLHAAETAITSAAFFVLVISDGWLRKKLVSLAFTAFMAGYGILFISQYARHAHFSTLSQYVYQLSLIVWLAWFCRDIVAEQKLSLKKLEPGIVKRSAAAWAFINGVAAIVISLAHINLLGRIKGLYFAGDNAWLAQHGVIIGVAMLYLSRHLFRGELRARQIFLAIAGIEVLKYSLISPNAILMSLYLITFVAFFLFRDVFNRGTVALTWSLRLKDIYFMFAGLLTAGVISLLALDRDDKAARITSKAFHNFFEYIGGLGTPTHSHLSSVLLAHTISVFIAAALASILWILFRPYKHTSFMTTDYKPVRWALERYSTSPEDFFKLWPVDKDYFWGRYKDGFIAYKVVGTVAFALADPISANPDALLKEFIDWARNRRLKACFFPIYKSSLELYQNVGVNTIQIGSSAVINVKTFTEQTSKDKWWRWKRNRAEKNGYVFNSSRPPHSEELLKRLKTVSDAWLTREGRTERSFAMGYFDETYLQNCDIHYLEDSVKRLVAFTNQLPRLQAGEVLTVDLLRFLPEANEAMPYLLYKVITLADTSNYSFFDLGFVPFAKTRGPVLKIAKIVSDAKFSSSGLEQFKNKFDPDWQPNYLAYDGDVADLTVIALHLEEAMALNNV